MYVGIDVSKKTLDVAVRPSGEQWSQGNDDVSIAGLCERLQAMKPRIIVLEATGGLELPLARLIGVSHPA